MVALFDRVGANFARLVTFFSSSLLALTIEPQPPSGYASGPLTGSEISLPSPPSLPSLPGWLKRGAFLGSCTTAMGVRCLQLHAGLMSVEVRSEAAFHLASSTWR